MQETTEGRLGVGDGGQGPWETASLRGCFHRWAGVFWLWLELSTGKGPS